MESALIKVYLIKVYFDLCMALSLGHGSLLGTAFDTVDFDILLKQLHDSFGICRKPLAWLISYITDHAQMWVSISPDLKR